MLSPIRALVWILLMVTPTMSMRLVTYNLRYDSKPDNITVQQSLNSLPDPLAQPVYLNSSSEKPWSTRRIRVAEHLLNRDVVLAGFQEALVRQVHDLAELLGKSWAWIGVGREDGEEAGEFSPIFYDQSIFELVSNDSFWLSNTPFEPSKFPDAGSFRICTVGTFSQKSDSKKFTVLNTHLDDQSNDQRELAASMLLLRAKYEAVHTKGPVFVTGDFNSPPNGEDSGAYQIITGASPPVAVNATFAAKYAVSEDTLPDFALLDVRGQTPPRSVNANYPTFTGFTEPEDTSAWTRIDFVFANNHGDWKADRYVVDTSLSDDGVLASDHRPTFVDLTL